MSHRVDPQLEAENCNSRKFHPIPYLVRIGVTGHRHLESPGSIRESLRRALSDVIPQLFPEDRLKEAAHLLSSKQAPLCYSILTPLAEGADRLVAQIVLETDAARLEVVLPMDAGEYRKDFASPQSLAEFDALLAQSRKTVCLQPIQTHTDAGDNAGADTGIVQIDRPACYEEVGRYVVNHVDLLVAIWDGEPARGRGGTAQIVSYAEQQGVAVLHIWQDSVKLRNRGRCTLLDFAALKEVHRFNQAKIGKDSYRKAFDDQDKDFFGDSHCSICVPETAKHLVRERLLPYYAWTSAVAEKCRDRFQSLGWLIYLMSTAAVACAAFGTILPIERLKPLCYVAELFILVAMALLAYMTHHAHAHSDWVEYRFLAERIRCMAYMAICGVEPAAFEVPPYMGKNEIANDWTARILGEIWLRIAHPQRQSGDMHRLQGYIASNWLQGQIDYHRKKTIAEGRKLKRIVGIGYAVYGLTICAAILHVVLEMIFPHAGESALGISFFALTLPALAASLTGIETHREFKRLKMRSENMKTRLTHLKRQLLGANSTEEFESLMKKIDKVMLQETLDWMTLMRHVEIKIG